MLAVIGLANSGHFIAGCDSLGAMQVLLQLPQLVTNDPQKYIGLMGWQQTIHKSFGKGSEVGCSKSCNRYTEGVAI